MIACKDSLIASSRDVRDLRDLVQSWVKRAKIEPKIRFLLLFSQVFSLVFLEISHNDSLQQCLTSSRGKSHEKKLEAQI